jgi:plastocyanin
MSILVPNLENGVEYVLQVAANNDAGGGVSTASNPVIPQVGAPEPVAVVDQVNASATTTTTVTSDPANTGPTANEPTTTSIDVPPGTGGGVVTVVEGTVNTTTPTGYQFLTTQTNIVSTVSTTSNDPLRITFTLDDSIIGSETPATLRVFRTESGVQTQVQDCASDPTAIAAPDPCIPASSRLYVNGADVTFTVVTSHASAWNFAPLPAAAVQVRDNGYLPSSAQATQSQRVTWTFTGAKSHSVTDAAKLGAQGKALFDSGVKGSGTYTYRFVNAGTYAYKSTGRGDSMNGTVGVPVIATPSSGTRATSYTVRWASTTLSSGYVEDVQMRYKPSGSTTWKAWSNWKTKQTAAFGRFMTSATGTYQFQARLRNAASGATTAYSPVTAVSVTP